MIILNDQKKSAKKSTAKYDYYVVFRTPATVTESHSPSSILKVSAQFSKPPKGTLMSLMKSTMSQFRGFIRTLPIVQEEIVLIQHHVQTLIAPQFKTPTHLTYVWTYILPPRVGVSTRPHKNPMEESKSLFACLVPYPLCYHTSPTIDAAHLNPRVSYIKDYLVTIRIDDAMYYPVPYLTQLDVTMVCSEEFLKSYLSIKHDQRADMHKPSLTASVST